MKPKLEYTRIDDKGNALYREMQNTKDLADIIVDRILLEHLFDRDNLKRIVTAVINVEQDKLVMHPKNMRARQHKHSEGQFAEIMFWKRVCESNGVNISDYYQAAQEARNTAIHQCAQNLEA